MQQVDFGSFYQELSAGLCCCRKPDFLSGGKQETDSAFGGLFVDDTCDGLCFELVRFEKVNQSFKERNDVARLRRNV